MRIFKENITSSVRAPSGEEPLYHIRSVIWIVCAVAALLLNRLIPQSVFEHWYYQGFFLWIRQTYDYVLGWLPFPMLYIILAIILIRTVLWFRAWNRGAWFQLSRVVGGLGAIITLFYVFWGFNYRQIPLQDRLGFNLGMVTQADIQEEFSRASSVLRQEAELLPMHLHTDDVLLSKTVKDSHLRPDVEKALALLGIPNAGRVRVRQLWPKGLLLRWSTAGIYIPHTGEGHIDKGLLSVQKPFTIAHEMAHGYGVTDEGACNFIAWLACSQSVDPWVRFSGSLTYWRYTAAEMPGDSVAQVLETFPPVVLNALTLIRQNDRKYPDLMPQVRDAIYSSYLKRHGVRGGLRSYNYVVMMVDQYLKSTSGGLPPE